LLHRRVHAGGRRPRSRLGLRGRRVGQSDQPCDGHLLQHSRAAPRGGSGGPAPAPRGQRRARPPASLPPGVRSPHSRGGPSLAEREKEYVEAVQALGATRLAVALKHVLPNVLSPFVVQGTVAFSQAVLIEASLSYLGLSAQPPTPSWGNMLNEGRTYLETAPWISVFPGIAIMVTVLAFNLLGDGLRDVLDPNSQ